MPRTATDDAFARALYAQLAGKSGNVAVSPASIRACLLLAAAGARGETAREMAAALKLEDVDPAHIAALLDAAMPRGTAGKKDLLTVANSAWMQQGFPIHQAYRRLLETNDRATFETVDFAQDAEAAWRAINAWVEKATRDKILELLAPGAVDSSTRLVLANAVYFKGDWQRPFDKDSTQDHPFKRPGQADVEVPLMHQVARFRYLETDVYQAIELPYKNGPYAMVVWLPKKLDGLDELQKQLTGGEAMKLDDLSTSKVHLFLPRFKVSSQTSLKDVLSAMGMAGAFAPNANFSGITDEPLWISAVVHQAVVEVDETGTEAAAATAIVMPTAALAPQPERMIVFRADHPFLFAIRNTTSGELTFMGRVDQPEN